MCHLLIGPPLSFFLTLSAPQAQPSLPPPLPAITRPTTSLPRHLLLPFPFLFRKPSPFLTSWWNTQLAVFHPFLQSHQWDLPLHSKIYELAYCRDIDDVVGWTSDTSSFSSILFLNLRDWRTKYFPEDKEIGNLSRKVESIRRKEGRISTQKRKQCWVIFYAFWKFEWKRGCEFFLFLLFGV